MITFTEAFILQEVFDPKNVNYEWEFDHIATFDVPTKQGKKGYAIYFTDKDDAVDISFAPEKLKDVSHEDYEPFERTGTGGTGAVLANVMAATMDYIKKNKPDKLTMHAADEGLGKLYKRMLSRYLPRSRVEQERRNLIVHLKNTGEED